MTRTSGMTRTVAASVGAAVAAALALVALTSCGSVEQGGGDSTAAPTSTSAATPTGPPEDLTVPPTRTGSKHSTVRVKGIVSDGIEPGCRLLTSRGVVYLLMGRQPAMVTGQVVEVEGTLQPDLQTTCQQGTPLVVERVLSP